MTTSAPLLVQAWDLDRSHPTLGQALTFAEHLRARCWDAGTSTGVLAFHGAEASRLAPHETPTGGCSVVDRTVDGLPVAFRAVFAWDHVLEVWLADARDALGRRAPGAVIADAPEPRGQDQYAATAFLHPYAGPGVPPLEPDPDARAAALDYLGGREGDVVLAVHLKNVSGQQSNANQDAWAEAFAQIAARGGVQIVCIGTDAVGPAVRAVPGVSVADDEGNDLARDLALIAEADAFIGMASGPCQVAIFRRRPYTIIKHPDHHPDEMERELGDAEAYPFAARDQRFVRAFDTADLIQRECERLIAAVRGVESTRR